MIEIESVAPSTTPELPEIPLAHQSHSSEYELDADKSIVSQFDAIAKNIYAAQEVIYELPDIEFEVAGIPVKLTCEMMMSPYLTYRVKLTALIDGVWKKLDHEATSGKKMFGKEFDVAGTLEVFNYIKSLDFQKEVEIRNKAIKCYDDAMGARKALSQTQFKGFEGIRIPERYRFEGCIANVVELVKKYDKDGEEKSTEERLTPIGNPCAIIARFRVDGIEKVMQRVRFITDNYNLKEVDVEKGQLSDTRSIIEFCKEHGCGSTRHDLFKQMLDDTFYENVNELPILEATTNVGWHNDSYVCGKECYGPDVICVDSKLCEMYYKEGTLDGYMQGIKGLVNIPEIRLAMGIVVASMLLSLVGVASFSVSLYGGTSNAKTLRWLLALAMFGNPLRIKMNFNHSKQAPNERLTHLRGAVLFIDEIKEEKERVESQRLIKENSDGVTREVHYFRTGNNESHIQSAILVFTSERPIFDDATYGGTRVRCMVLKTREDFPFLKDEIREFEKLVSPKSTTDRNPKNFGHLGPLVYDVIMKHPNLRDEFDAIKNQFAPTTAIENRIADMQAVTALGMKLLDEVFDGLRDKHPWLERMDSVQVVKDQTADYVEESTVPEWELQLQHLLSKVDGNRRYLDPDPVIDTDDEGNKTERKKEGTYPVRGYLHKIAGEELLCLNSVETEEYLRRKNMNPETLFSGVRNNSEMLKTYNKKNKKGETIKGGLKIQIHQKDNIPGGLYYALRIEKLREWFKDHECDDEEGAEEEEETIAAGAEIDAINAREAENLPLLKKYYTKSAKITFTMPMKTYEDRFMENIDNFILWYETQGHSHEEAVQKADELKSRIKLKQEQLTFYNSMIKRGKAKEWSPKIELFWINNK